MAKACTCPSENLVLVLALVLNYMARYTIIKTLPLVLGFTIISSLLVL